MADLMDPVATPQEAGVIRSLGINSTCTMNMINSTVMISLSNSTGTMDECD